MFELPVKASKNMRGGSRLPRYVKAAGAAAVSFMITGSAFAADLASPTITPPVLTPPQFYNWNGGFVGGNLGYSWGSANYTVQNTSNPGVIIDRSSHTLSQTINSYDNETGSWFAGLQAGYNYMLPNRVVVGGVADLASSSIFNITTGLQTGGTSTILGGTQSFTENVQEQGTFRARIGYAPRDWFYYATGGLAWDYEQRLLSGNPDPSYRARVGYAVGAGVEAPLIPQWTAFAEFMYNHYGSSSVTYPIASEKFTSRDQTYQVKVGVNYHPTDGTTPSLSNQLLKGVLDADRVNFHLDTVAVYQGYPSFNSPFSGAKSFRGNGEAREIAAVDLFAGVKLWNGAEFWVNPELNQGFGVSGVLGIAGFPNNSSFKIGQAAPYARVEDYFIRQTFNFDGATSDLAAGEVNFAGTQSDHRLVITAGRIPFSIDGYNKAYDIRAGFSTWNGGFPISVDYGTDAFGSTYGALFEYYFGRYAIRFLYQDETQQPGDTLSGQGVPLAKGFGNFHANAELEENHTIFGQPGTIKVLGFIDHGSMANINSAISYYNTFGPTPEAAALGVGASFEPVRHIATKPGFLLNLYQSVTKDIGFFALFGEEDGRYEIVDDADSDLYTAVGVQVAGTKWGRPDDTFGVMGALSNISGEYKQFLADGGLGLTIGDGQLPSSGPEKNFDIYYKYQIYSTTSLTLDYQHVVNPAYDSARGPVNLFLGRVRFYY